MPYLRSFVFALIAVAGSVGTDPVRGQSNCIQTPEGRVCTITQPIIGGELVPIPTQQELGLIKVGGGCSGTLLNRFWVLTADHCVSSDGRAGGPAANLSTLRITATWSPRRPTPTRLVRNWHPSLDLALIFLGAGDFGEVNIQTLMLGAVTTSTILTKYGTGFSTYASAGPPPVAAKIDDAYRSARFVPFEAVSLGYRLAANPSGQVGAAGDSGGPDVATTPDGTGLGIAGVSSSCVAAYLPGKPQDWTWVTEVSGCFSSAISTVRREILDIITEGRIPCPNVSAACAIIESTSLLLLSN